MSFLNTLKKLTFPSPKDILNAPQVIRNESQRIDLNTINVNIYDRFFKRRTTVKGIKENKTSIPIVYFDVPYKGAVILFDDCTYIDEQTKIETIDIVEDYPFALNRNTEYALLKDLEVQYYNDSAQNKMSEISKLQYEKTGCAYSIPVFLNRIPREIIRINTNQKMRIINSEYIENKIEITQFLIRQISKIKMLERVGKPDNSVAVIAIILGWLIGAVMTFVFTLMFIR